MPNTETIPTGRARPTEIPDHRIVNLPAELLRPGDVTLYGVVLDIETVDGEVQLDCWGQHTVTSWAGRDVTVLGRVSAATLAQLRAQLRAQADR